MLVISNSLRIAENKHKGWWIFSIVGGLFSAVFFWIYIACFYNPIRLPCKQDLARAVDRGLVIDCRAILVSGDKVGGMLAEKDWPASVKLLHPRQVFVNQTDPKAVEIVLWLQFHDWEWNLAMGLKGRAGVLMKVYLSSTPYPTDTGNEIKQNPFSVRKISDGVYLSYLKALQPELMSRTDLLGR